MLQPLFTYPVQGTAWYIVVAKGASHFYFDAETGTSVWQLSDTNIEDLASKVNFDDLAVLFAKANGLRLGPKESGSRKRKFPDTEERPKQSEISDESAKLGVKKDSESLSSAENQQEHKSANNEENYPDDQAEEELNSPSVESTENPIVSENDAKPAGLDLGYSSSEDEDEDEGEGDGGEEVDENKDGEDSGPGTEEASVGSVDVSDEEEDVNSGLDLAFESEDEMQVEEKEHEARKDFESLLEEFKNEISVYDPWFLIEEELLPQLSQNPAFYALKDTQAREKIFDEWVARKIEEEKDQKETKTGKFPTEKLRFFQFLQEFKPEVRKSYYSDFYKNHSTEIDSICSSYTSINPENLYRELRVTLNDYAEHEKAQKKRKIEGNLKVAHVENYLRHKLTGVTLNPQNVSSSLPTDATFFDRWIHLCNQYDLPEQIVNDANNFVVGDEKRLACYLHILTSS